MNNFTIKYNRNNNEFKAIIKDGSGHVVQNFKDNVKKIHDIPSDMISIESLLQILENDIYVKKDSIEIIK
ncbi:MAG: hypothetical protein ACRC5M_02730 [Anaeroplasmataceae bacterium]